MALTAAEVRHVASLARLALSDEEVEQARAQLSLVLDAADALSGVDTEGVLPTAQVGAEVRMWREDQTHVPLGVDGPFRVPRVIEQP